MKKRLSSSLIIGLLALAYCRRQVPVSEQPIAQIESRALAAAEKELPAGSSPTFQHVNVYRIDEGAVACGEVSHESGLGWRTQFMRFIASENGKVVMFDNSAARRWPLDLGSVFDGAWAKFCRH